MTKAVCSENIIGLIEKKILERAVTVQFCTLFEQNDKVSCFRTSFPVSERPFPVLKRPFFDRIL